MKLSYSKRIWGLTTAIAFLLSSVPYPAYGMRMLAPDSRVKGGEIDEDIIDIAYKIGAITHKEFTKAIEELAKTGHLGYIIGTVPDEFREIAENIEELSPRIGTAIHRHKLSVEHAIKRIKEKYEDALPGLVEYKRRTYPYVQTATDRQGVEEIEEWFKERGEIPMEVVHPIDRALSRIALYEVKDKAAAIKLFGRGKYQYEHWGRFGGYIDLDMFERLVKESDEVSEGETPLERFITHAIFELAIRDILVEYEKKCESLWKDAKPESPSFSKLEVKIKKLVKQLTDLGIPQEDVEKILIKDYSSTGGIKRVEFTSDVAHQLVERLPYASLKPINSILQAQIAEDRNEGKVIRIAAAEKGWFERTVKKAMQGDVERISIVAQNIISGSPEAERRMKYLFTYYKQTPNSLLRIKQILQKGLSFLKQDDASSKRINNVFATAKKAASESGFVLELNQDNQEVILRKESPVLVGAEGLNVAYAIGDGEMTKAKTDKEIIALIKTYEKNRYETNSSVDRMKLQKELQKIGTPEADILGERIFYDFYINALLRPISEDAETSEERFISKKASEFTRDAITKILERLKLNKTSPELGLFMVKFLNETATERPVNDAKRIILSRHKPVFGISKEEMDKITSVKKAKQSGIEAEVCIDASVFLRETEEGTYLPLGNSIIPEIINRSLSTNAEIVVVTLSESQSEKRMFQEALRTKENSHIIVLTPSEDVERMNKEKNVKRSLIIAKKTIEMVEKQKIETSQSWKRILNRIPDKLTTEVDEFGENEENGIWYAALAHLGYLINGEISSELKELLRTTYRNNGATKAEVEAIGQIDVLIGFPVAIPVSPEAEQYWERTREVLGEKA